MNLIVPRFKLRIKVCFFKYLRIEFYGKTNFPFEW